MEIISGRAHKFGDNINTDIISPPQYMDLSVQEAAQYALSAVDPDFATRFQAGDIIVAGDNFGSGSSRELAPLTLKYLGAGAVVAKFFARIFYRNAINIGLPVVECPETDKIASEDFLRLDVEKGLLKNETKNETYVCTALPPHIAVLIERGGLVPFLREKLSAEK